MAGIHIDISTANPKQIAFFMAHNRFVAYGGARGGGKSWAVQRKAILLAMNYAGIKILLLRRTYKDLERNHARELERLLMGYAKYNKQDKLFSFPNGSIIELGYCAADSDALQYQGQEYDIVMLDEATQFTEYQYEILTACIRGANGYPKRMYLTCNPGGVGHEWVKRLFITKKYKEKENPEDYVFIPATVFDNKILLENDPGYVTMLDNLSEELRGAWRDGNWDMLAGQYFSEFDRSYHVVDPFPIPEYWKRYRAIDYGLDCLACVWIAVDELGNCYLYREYAEPDKIISVGASEVLELSKEEKVTLTYAPPDLWGRSQESARSRADIFWESGLSLFKASNNRESGWMAVHELLKLHKTDDGVESKLKIFSTCPTVIEHLAALQRDPHRPNDCMTEPHDITHLPDAVRYFATGYIGKTKVPEQKTEMQKYKERRIREVARRGF